MELGATYICSGSRVTSWFAQKTIQYIYRSVWPEFRNKRREKEREWKRERGCCVVDISRKRPESWINPMLQARCYERRYRYREKKGKKQTIHNRKSTKGIIFVRRVFLILQSITSLLRWRRTVAVSGHAVEISVFPVFAREAENGKGSLKMVPRAKQTE